MTLVKEASEKLSYAYRRYYNAPNPVPIWPLVLLIISFFYCLPLGRFSIGRFDSDFRIFDFAILFSYSYYLSNGLVNKEISILLKSKSWFLRWSKILIILVLISVVVALLYSGTSYMLPRMIRLYRFLSYLFIPFIVFSVVRTKADYLLFFRLFFILSALVGVIAFFQGLGRIPNFWPDYWRIMYGENDAPVATLSPHHKHIGVIMLVGICLSVSLWFRAKAWLLKIVIALLCLVMFTVPLFTGTRTYLLGFVGVIPALFFIGKGKAVLPILLMTVGSIIFLQYYGDAISSRVERKFDERVTSRIEKLGYEGLYRERTIIYWNILDAVIRSPYLLITGTGFQNIRSFVGATGAHNNYFNVMMELGLGGLVVFISLFAKLWQNLKLTVRIKDKDISLTAQYTLVALSGVLMTMFVGETFWGQPSMFTLAGQLSFLFGLAVSPLYWLNRYSSAYKPKS